MLDAIDRRPPHDRLPDVRVLEGRDRHASSRTRSRPRPTRGVRVRVLLDSWGARTIERALVDLLEGAGVDVRWFRPLGRLPTRPDEPPHAPQGADRRRGDGVHRRCRHRRRVARATRRTRTSGATRTSASRGPAVDGLRAAFLDNWSETEPELFDEAVDRFPDHRPGPGSAVVQCVRGASETGNSDIYTLFRTLHPARASSGSASRPRTSSPTTRSSTGSCDAAASRRRGRAPPPRSARRQAIRAARERGDATRRCSTRASASGRIQPTMLHAKVMTVDGVVANIGSANFNARSTTPRRGDQRRRDRPRPRLGAGSAVRRRSRVEPARRSRRVAPALTGRTRGGTGALAVPSRCSDRAPGVAVRPHRQGRHREARQPEEHPDEHVGRVVEPAVHPREADRGDHDDCEHAGRGAHGRPGSAAADDDREPGEQDGRRRGVTRREARRRRGGVEPHDVGPGPSHHECHGQERGDLDQQGRAR